MPNQATGDIIPMAHRLISQPYLLAATVLIKTYRNYRGVTRQGFEGVGLKIYASKMVSGSGSASR